MPASGREGEIEMVRRAIRRTLDLIARQEEQVDALNGHPEQEHAETLLRLLRTRLEFYKARLTDLTFRSG